MLLQSRRVNCFRSVVPQGLVQPIYLFHGILKLFKKLLSLGISILLPLTKLGLQSSEVSMHIVNLGRFKISLNCDSL